MCLRARRWPCQRVGVGARDPRPRAVQLLQISLSALFFFFFFTTYGLCRSSKLQHIRAGKWDSSVNAELLHKLGVQGLHLRVGKESLQHRTTWATGENPFRLAACIIPNSSNCALLQLSPALVHLHANA